MTLRFPVAISVLCLSSLATFAGNDTPTPDQALAQNREMIKEQVASLNSDLAKFTKVLKDDKVSPDDKASEIRKVYASFLCGYPNDSDELVQIPFEILDGGIHLVRSVSCVVKVSLADDLHAVV